MKKHLSLLMLSVACLVNLASCFSTNEKQILTGTWKFVADQLLDNKGKVIRQDTSVYGLIIYDLNGKVSVNFFWKGNRAAMINDSIMKQDGQSTGLGLGFNTWTGSQARKLIDTYDAYFGDYSIDWPNKSVNHIITASLRPEKDGTVFKRTFLIKGDSLFLRSADTSFRWQVACIRIKSQGF